MAQLALLTLLCKDPTSGLVVAGDTAQTITKGVAFRFADVGALLHQLHYGLLGAEDSDGCAAGSCQEAAAADSEQQPQPPLRQEACSRADSPPVGSSTAKQHPQEQQQRQPRQQMDRVVSAPAVLGESAANDVQREAKTPKRVAKSLAFAESKHLQRHARAAALMKRAESVGSSSSKSSSADKPGMDAGKTAPRDKQAKGQQQLDGRRAVQAPASEAVTVTSSRSGSAVSAAARGGSSSTRALRLPPVAAQLTLRQNWRTQSSILAVAHAITEVLYQMFPGTVDKLPAETSSVTGDTPLLLAPGQHNDPLLMVFNSSSSSSNQDGSQAAASRQWGSSSSSSHGGSMAPSANLNAQTAVLVRDDAAAAVVRRMVGDGALVLSAAEAKGLEFEVSLQCCVLHR